VLYTFCAQPKCADGMYPGPIIDDANGNIFGVTGAGGTHPKGGVVYEYTP
jgi:hypothetical protein